MNILAFDTCLDRMYVALGNDEKVLDSKVVETTKEHYHSAFLISTIRDILKENNLKPTDIDVFATNIGPGSFTGIRACTTVARVAAQANKAKVVGINSLELLSKLNKDVSKTLVALDARKQMAYVAIYENNSEKFAPKAVLIEDVIKMIKSEQVKTIITDEKMETVFDGKSYLSFNENLGEFLIEIAREKINSGCATDWRKLHPLYIQPPALNI